MVIIKGRLLEYRTFLGRYFCDCQPETDSPCPPHTRHLASPETHTGLSHFSTVKSLCTQVQQRNADNQAIKSVHVKSGGFFGVLVEQMGVLLQDTTFKGLLHSNDKQQISRTEAHIRARQNAKGMIAKNYLYSFITGLVT